MDTQQNTEDVSKLKQPLKQQCKQLLLRGCYKMASNKYNRLIDMGADGFTQRQWSIIHLNTAITLHFQDKLQQALQRVNQAITIDKFYDKAYYRRLQILQQLNQQQFILLNETTIIPQFIHNKEIDQLKDRIVQEYQTNLGLRQLQQKLDNTKFTEKFDSKQKIVKFIEESYGRIFHRMITNNVNDQNTMMEIGEHYRYIKEKIQRGEYERQIYSRVCDKYCLEVMKIFMNNHNWDIEECWKYYIKYYLQHNLSEVIFKENTPLTNQLRLLSYFPCLKFNQQLFIKILNKALSVDMVIISISLLVQFINTNLEVILKKDKAIKQAKLQLKYLSDNLETLMLIYGEKLADHINRGELDIYRMKSILIMDLRNMRDHCDMGFSVKSKISIDGFAQALINKNRMKNKELGEIFEQFVRMLDSNPHSLACRYFINQILSQLKLELVVKNASKMQQIIIGQMIFLQQHQDNNYNRQTLMQILIRYSIFAKLSGFNVRKYKSNKQVKINKNGSNINGNQKQQEIIQVKLNDIADNLMKLKEVIYCITSKNKQKVGDYKQLDSNQMIVIEYYIKVLGDICLCYPEKSLKIMENSSILKQILQKLLTTQKKPQLSPINLPYQIHQKITPKIIMNSLHASTLILLYTCLIDIESQQQSQFADKMGVTIEEIKHARKIQGQDTVKSNKQQKKKFGKVIANDSSWNQILKIIMSKFHIQFEQLGQDSEQFIKISIMIVKILEALSSENPKKFYNSEYVTLMLKIFIICSKNKDDNIMYRISSFFCNICKDCNPQIFKYSQIQTIANILLYGIQHTKHQLHTFESLLGLVQLSSQKITIPFKVPLELLMQQNQYIVHAAFEVLNNLLILQAEQIASEQLAKSLERITEFSLKYYLFYKEQVYDNELSKTNTNDYSHPCKVFCTILSVLMILEELCPNIANQKFQKFHKLIQKTVVEFQDEEETMKILQRLKGDFSTILFKLIMHHAQKKSKLRFKYSERFPQQIQLLKRNDSERWQKLQRYINR